MRVGFVGPSQSGKSTLFAAVAESGGSHVDLSRPDQPHLAVVKVPDERLAWLGELYQPKKVTPAELELLDLPGFDLSDDAGRTRAKTHWPAMRQCDGLALVVRAFPDDAVAAYRNRIDPKGDVEELLSEFLFADLEQVTTRVEKLEVSVKKPTPKRDEQLRELELMKRLLDALENEKPICDVIANEMEDKLVRSFGFLTQKPALVVVNCSEDDISDADAESLANLPTLKLSAKIEEEIAELPPEDRGEFLRDLGLSVAAGDRLVRACYERMKLISFLTVGEDECRAWTIPAGTDAVTAASKIHSDIARGFIRAETVAYDHFHAAGDMKAAKAAGHVRLEGKTYTVQDGDIINFRFNV
ncbi:MAG: redox-regulated ATPase YchF [Phycisphaerae bacterium]|nr:redox-regulated ATPase YchF [Phycisphaerae bacterium]